MLPNCLMGKTYIPPDAGVQHGFHLDPPAVIGLPALPSSRVSWYREIPGIMMAATL
jgi:hypothetical protein